jgi:hypothetical protein
MNPLSQSLSDPRKGKKKRKMATVTPTITEPPAYSPSSSFSSSFSSSSSSSSSHEDLLNLRPSSSTPPPAYTERAVRKLKITALLGEGILNVSILNTAGHTLYTTSSYAKLKKTSVQCLGPYLDSDTDADVDTVNVVTVETGEELARFGWDRVSPHVRFGSAPDKKQKKKQRKVKCKEWLPLANSNSGATSNLQYVFLFHQQSSILMACLLAPLPADLVF